ncbi:uroporphyrinogen-III synthase [Sphingomonas aliaeris]|uniref:Uroporphyrinogen-III synthase n=1 Tax=Sphingomonas aliaeris TaxID=2759526 RepID=A0A974NVU9_9SPHN|nr:uroporphyrinogen-III synthase [Sphingomonas aliaeris]
MRIWVTRTTPGNQSTVESLQALGHEVVCVPVLNVRRIDADPLRSLPDAIVFTSGNGVRHHPMWPEALDLPVFTVGNRTADAVIRAGYRNVRSANGDLRDLQTLILNELPPPGRIVHFGAREPAGDLKGHLRRFGYLVDRKIVYIADAVALRWLLQVRTDLPNIDGIMVHWPAQVKGSRRCSLRPTGRGRSGAYRTHVRRSWPECVTLRSTSHRGRQS